MNVLHIVPSYYPAVEVGGPVQSVHEINKYMAKKGINIDVLTLTVGLEKNKSIVKDGWSMIDSVKIKYLNYLKPTRYNFSLSFLLSCFRILKRYDVIHITGIWNFPVLAGALASVFYKKPFVLSPRGSLYEETVSMKSSAIKKFYLFLFRPVIIGKAAVMHYTTEDEKEKVQSFLKTKKESTVIPNGIDIERIRSQRGSNAFFKSFPELMGKKYILSLGRITPKKGFDILLPAFAELIKPNPELNLVIAGPDDRGYTEQVKKMVSQLRLTDKVFFTGLIEGEVKWSAYENAELFVLPSYSENFGNVVIEAMTCDTPVVISDKVGIHKDVKDYGAGIIVKPHQWDLYEGLSGILNNDELRKKLVNNAQKLVKEKYDINIVAEKMIEAYKRCIRS